MKKTSSCGIGKKILVILMQKISALLCILMIFNFLKHIFMNLKFCPMRTLHWFFKRQFGPVPTILVVQARRAASSSTDGTL